MYRNIGIWWHMYIDLITGIKNWNSIAKHDTLCCFATESWTNLVPSAHKEIIQRCSFSESNMNEAVHRCLACWKAGPPQMVRGIRQRVQWVKWYITCLVLVLHSQAILIYLFHFISFRVDKLFGDEPAPIIEMLALLEVEPNGEQLASEHWKYEIRTCQRLAERNSSPKGPQERCVALCCSLAWSFYKGLCQY